MKRRTIFYYLWNPEEATRLMKAERVKGNVGYSRDASSFIPADMEDCDAVVILPDVPAHYASLIRRSYQNKVETAPAATASEKLISGAGHRDTESAAPSTEPVRVAPPTPEPEAEEVDLTIMTRRMLMDHASDLGLRLDQRMKRDDMISAIRQHSAA